LNSELDFRLQFQVAAQVVPSSTNQAKSQITISADTLEAIGNWILGNPGQALLWGGGLVIGAKLLADWLNGLSQPPRRRISR
jgi:hypothetical protein